MAAKSRSTVDINVKNRALRTISIRLVARGLVDSSALMPNANYSVQTLVRLVKNRANGAVVITLVLFHVDQSVLACLATLGATEN